MTTTQASSDQILESVRTILAAQGVGSENPSEQLMRRGTR